MELAQQLNERLKNRQDIVSRTIRQGPFVCTIYYMMDAVNLDMLQTYVLQPLTQPYEGSEEDRMLAIFERRAYFAAPYALADSPEAAIEGLLNGQAVLCIASQRKAVLFPFPRKSKRDISITENEKTIRGPKEGFVEDIWDNLSLVRQRIKSEHLAMESMVLGNESRTTVMMLYMNGRCDAALVADIRAKLESIHVDYISGSGFLEESMDDRLASPFPKMLNTERPDVVASSLMEGRIAILTDGTPSNLVLPATLLSFMQSPEDYYQRYFFSSWVRLLRYSFFGVSLVLPSAYVAITTFHPEMLPYSLLISIASSRDMVPFPAILEAMIMEVTFEVMREAGQRIPTTLGPTISIVGAIVIGEAAVQAGIVSAPMVIIVAITGISSFLVPHFSLTLTVRFLRFVLLFLSAIFGLLGLLIGVFLVFIHLLSLESFGTPYLSPFLPFESDRMKDAAGRFPWSRRSNAAKR